MKELMEEALKEARGAISAGEVPVGCIFIHNNQIIARGCNDVNATKNATRHAELVCIDQTFEFFKQNHLNWKDAFPDVSVIVTVEPCIMCASALYELDVKEIIYGCINDRFGGETVVNIETHFQKNIKTTSEIRASEAMELLKDFYKGENPSAPEPKSKK